MINDAFAATLAGGGVSALGQTLRVAHGPRPAAHVAEVVGIVADRLTTRGRPTPAIYLPMPRETPSWIVLAVRASQPASAANAIKAAVSAAISRASLGQPRNPRGASAPAGQRLAQWSVGRWVARHGRPAPCRCRPSRGPDLHDSPPYPRDRHPHGCRGRQSRSCGRPAARARTHARRRSWRSRHRDPPHLRHPDVPRYLPSDPLAMLTPLSMLLASVSSRQSSSRIAAATVDPIVVLHDVPLDLPPIRRSRRRPTVFSRFGRQADRARQPSIPSSYRAARAVASAACPRSLRRPTKPGFGLDGRFACRSRLAACEVFRPVGTVPV